MSCHPDSEDLFGMKLLYDIIIFFLCGCLGWTGTLFLCVCVFSFQPRPYSYNHDPWSLTQISITSLSELSEREVIETEMKLEMTMIDWELFEIAQWQVTIQTQKEK